MKTSIVALVLCIVSSGWTSHAPADVPIKGAWMMIKSKYGNETTYTDNSVEKIITYKLFTGTRWSASTYNSKTKKITGTAGGSYQISGGTYTEKVDYYSWDAATEGKNFTFTMTIEDGMLHQIGYIVYQNNSHYLIDEWYKRVD